jgi:hypothetical protein
MTPAPQDELSWLEWTLGIVIASFGAAIGHLYNRTGRLSDRARDELRDLRESDLRDLWNEVREAEARFQTHRGDVLSGMVTKGDLAAAEARIMAAIQRGHQSAA